MKPFNLIFLSTFLFLQWFTDAIAQVQSHKDNVKQITILSIDGGGIRGIIPLMVLKNLESRLKGGYHITEYFDIMAGTSTGGIITLLLNTPNIDGKPKYNTLEILEVYKKFGKEVFHASLWQKIKSGWNWWGSKYSKENLEKCLKEYFGGSELKDTLSNVIIPAFDIEMDKTFFFKTNRAKTNPLRNYMLKDIARATSAAPTYFEPAEVMESTKQYTYILVDGGMSVNNPTISAAAYAVELFGKDVHLFVVSLGTQLIAG